MEPSALNGTLDPWEPGLLALLVYGLLVLALMALLLFLSSWLGEKKGSADKQRPFECGLIPTGPARLDVPAPFYRVAVFFLIFDVEAVFIFSWAVAALDLGWAGWLQISFFILLLLAGLIYIWRWGGLAWVQDLEKIRSAEK
jgi:NADH-quinone oxidoreductase subunit A